MLSGLRLGTWLIGGYNQYGSIHNGCAGEHGGHEGFVAGGVHKTDCSYELAGGAAVRTGGFCGVTLWWLAFGALVDGGVCVAEFDGYTPLQLLAVPSCPNARYGFDKCGFSMIHVADCSDVDLRLFGQLFQPIRLPFSLFSFSLSPSFLSFSVSQQPSCLFEQFPRL